MHLLIIGLKDVFLCSTAYPFSVTPVIKSSKICNLDYNFGMPILSAMPLKSFTLSNNSNYRRQAKSSNWLYAKASKNTISSPYVAQ